jgi:Coenzyme PQQ synthesis protein D (PqqD)
VIALRSRFKPRAGIVKQEMSGSLLLFNMEDGQYYTLNDVGRRVWELCDGTRSLSDIAEDLSHEYDSPAAAIRDDVLELVGDLADAALLVPVAEPA